jgi:hypothetical protein
MVRPWWRTQPVEDREIYQRRTAEEAPIEPGQRFSPRLTEKEVGGSTKGDGNYISADRTVYRQHEKKDKEQIEMMIVK